jgi:succinate dehydrogenase / fumarate reductase membrane anchor subunit
MVRRQAVGAHYGLRDWLMQRITGLAIALYVIILVAALLADSLDLVAWQGLFKQTWFRLATFATFTSIFLHAWVGMRDIIMDYIRAASLRLALEVLVAAVLVAYAGWAIQILWGLR